MEDAAAHLDHPVLLACRELGRAMDLFDEAACARLGLGRSDLRALNALEHGPVGASALAERLGLTRSAITALIDRLVAAGFVTRVAVPGDRRATAIELNPATWQAFAEVYRPLGDGVAASVDALPGSVRQALATALTAMSSAFDEARERLGAAAGDAATAGADLDRTTPAGRRARRNRS